MCLFIGKTIDEIPYLGKGIYLQVLGEDAINVVSAKLSTIANRLLDASLGEDERNTERSQTQ